MRGRGNAVSAAVWYKSFRDTGYYVCAVQERFKSLTVVPAPNEHNFILVRLSPVGLQRENLSK